MITQQNTTHVRVSGGTLRSMVRALIKKGLMLLRESDGKNYRMTRILLDLDGVLSIRRRYHGGRISAHNVPAEWNIPRHAHDKRSMLYLHGGAYIGGSLLSHRELVYQLAEAAQARALAVDYRLAPEHPHPAAVEDAVSAYTWLLQDVGDPSHITVMGDSAGGGLTLLLLQALRDRGISLPACAVCLYPWADLSSSGETMRTHCDRDPMLTPKLLDDCARYYAAGLDLQSPYISPLFGDLSGLPPILIQVGTDEILLDDSRRVAEKAHASGTTVELQIWPEMFHGWHAFPLLIPEAMQSINEIKRFIEQHMGNSVVPKHAAG